MRSLMLLLQPCMYNIICHLVMVICVLVHMVLLFVEKKHCL